MSVADSYEQAGQSLADENPLAILRNGTAIPAHPLALDAGRKLDRRRQRALTRYYIDAGAGGLAVGVHTTQFAIRKAGLYSDVLGLAIDTASQWTDRPMVMIAGLAGQTEQAINEAQTARHLGYHAGLLSLSALKGQHHDVLLEHCRKIAGEIPLVGFYLQPAVGGMELDVDFWTQFSLINNVVAIKVAAFNRYRSLDVMRGVVEARAEDRIALYTGNDDHIILDLLTPFKLKRGDEAVTVRFVGGLLGHWSVWTKTAIEMYRLCRNTSLNGNIPSDLLALDGRVTDCNSAFFDVANDFRGCIAGCHEVLRRQGLLEDIWCLDPDEGLSPGQSKEIDRVYAAHRDLSDDAFVQSNLKRWMG